MRAIVVGLLFLGLTSLCYAQNKDGEMLSEVEVNAINYDYLKSVEVEFIPFSVRSLEIEVANFDVHESSVIIIGDENDYQDEDGNYNVKFTNNNGFIKAVYNEEGIVLEATERFKNIKMPRVVLKSISEKYPNCKISKGLYLVTYNHDEGTTKKYVIILKNNNKRVKIKSDENGNIS